MSNYGIKLKMFPHIYKMVTLKDLETYLKVKDYIEESNVTIEDLLKSLNDKLIPVTVDCDGVSKKFYSLASAASYMNVSLSTINYAYWKKRDTIRKMKGKTKVNYIKWS